MLRPSRPKSAAAWAMGANAERPVPTKLNRRNVRHWGPENLGFSRIVVVRAPRDMIWMFKLFCRSERGFIVKVKEEEDEP